MSTPTPTRWHDDATPDPAWAAPSVTLTSRWRTPWAIAGLVVLAVAVIVGVLVAVGGFAKRTDIDIAAKPGETLVCGPYELAFTRATVQKQTDYDDKIIWKLTVIGTVANTGTAADSPPYSGDYGMFVARDLATREVQIPSGAKIGSGGFTDWSTVAPGLPPIPYQVSFDFSADYVPGKTIDFHAAQLELRNRSLVSDEKEWANADRFYRLDLPIELLPEKKP